MAFWSKKERSCQDGKCTPWDESDQLEAGSNLDSDSVSDSVRLRKAGTMTFLASIVGQAARLTYLRAFKLGGGRRSRSTSISALAKSSHQNTLPIGARARRASLPCLPPLPTVPTTVVNGNGQHIPSVSLSRPLHTSLSSSSTAMVLGFGKSWSATGKVGAFVMFGAKTY